MLVKGQNHRNTKASSDFSDCRRAEIRDGATSAIECSSYLMINLKTSRKTGALKFYPVHTTVISFTERACLRHIL